MVISGESVLLMELRSLTVVGFVCNASEGQYPGLVFVDLLPCTGRICLSGFPSGLQTNEAEFQNTVNNAGGQET
jgi:hypothetical protein